MSINRIIYDLEEKINDLKNSELMLREQIEELKDTSHLSNVIDVLEPLISELSKLDCGDSSCRFAKVKSGQRTNGGCRCLTGIPQGLTLQLKKIHSAQK